MDQLKFYADPDLWLVQMTADLNVVQVGNTNPGNESKLLAGSENRPGGSFVVLIYMSTSFRKVSSFEELEISSVIFIPLLVFL